MSFLKLSPAARRVRQAARAHAAGEMPRDDYRRMRREIIEELHVEFGSGGRVLDGFRLQADETQRRSQRKQHEQPTPASEPVIQPRRSAIRYVVMLVLGLALLVSVAAFANTIPPLSERDPNPANSLVLKVTGVRLANLAAEDDLDDVAIQAQLDEWFAEAQSQAMTTAAHGFTDAELAEVGGLLNRLGAHGADGLDESAGGPLAALLARQKQRRGVTLQQMERIAEKLQAKLRQQGFLAARAYVPSQVVSGATVELHAQLGRLDALQLESTTPLAALTRTAFASELGKIADSSRMEQLLYQLNELPGVRAEGTLRAGADVGMTQLDLRLENPRDLLPSLQLDNVGDTRSSRYRLRAGLVWRNPLRRGDLLQVALAPRFKNNSSLEAAISYQTPLRKLGNSLRLAYAFEDFSVDRMFDEVDGDSSTVQLGFRSLIVGQREKSFAVNASIVHQTLELADRRQRLWWIEPGANAHRVLDNSRWVLRGSASLFVGKIDSGRYAGQSSGFVLGRAEVSAWHPVGAQELRLEFGGQLGSQDLPDSLKFSLGGNQRVHVLPPSAFVADSALFAGAELTLTPDALNKWGDLGVFSRISHGQQQLGDMSDSAFAWEGGVVWRLAERRGITGDLRLSLPFSTDGFEDSHDDARILFRLAWQP